MEKLGSKVYANQEITDVGYRHNFEATYQSSFEFLAMGNDLFLEFVPT